MENLNNTSQDSYFVYFIESHIITASPTITISADNEGLFGELEKEKDNKYSEQGKNDKFLYSIYHFKIYTQKIKEQNKKELEIKIMIENEGEKFENRITIIDLDKDNYIYDLEFKEKGIIKKFKPPKAIKFTRIQQFTIFKDYLMKDLGINKKNNKKREDLIFSTQKLFKEKFWFNFFIIIFLECISPLSWRKHFSYFDPLKIEGKGEIDELIQKQSDNFVGIVARNSNKILENCKDEKEKELNGIQLYTFVLYYYYEYNKPLFLEYLKNNDKNIRSYINNVLIKYSNVFLDQKLPKERVQELINISKTFEQFSNSLQYLDLLLELLEIILKNFEIFIKLYQNEKIKNKSPKINIETIIKPREEDNIEEICKKYKDLINMQKDLKNLISEDLPIFISGSVFDKYIKFFNGNNIDNLFYIKEIKKELKIDSIKEDINKSIFYTLLKISKKRNISNLKLLEYIKKLIEDNQIEESLKLISVLDTYTFNDIFYYKWKKMNWNKILENNENIFKDKVIGLINDLREFNLLFKLLNISSKSDQVEIKTLSLEKMRIKFLELFLKNKDIDYKIYIILLITFSKKDKKEGENDVQFLEKLQAILEEEKMKDLCSTLLSEYRTILNEEIIKFIKFYTKDDKTDDNNLILNHMKFNNLIISTSQREVCEKNNILIDLLVYWNKIKINIIKKIECLCEIFERKIIDKVINNNDYKYDINGIDKVIYSLNLSNEILLYKHNEIKELVDKYEVGIKYKIIKNLTK